MRCGAVINGIIGMDTMLLKNCDTCDTEEIREYAKNILSASQTLLSIVNDILDISKIESGKMEIIPVEYELFTAWWTRRFIWKLLRHM